MRSRSIILSQLLAFLAFAVVIQIAPHFELAPRVDSSIFIYMGHRVLKGDVPYKDMWDHKGPLIYYINALGLVLADERWGIWLLELAAVATATLLGFYVFKRAFGLWPALFAATLFVVELRLVLDKGNMTEEYALPLQMLLLWLIWRAVESRRAAYYFGIGAAAAFCFLLRPNIIGIPVAFGATLLVAGGKQRQREIVSNLAVTTIGGFLVIGWAFIYFLTKGALLEMLDAMFVFNFLYNAGEEGGQMAAITAGFRNLPIATAIGVAGWLFAVLSPALKEKTLSPFKVINWLIVIGLPIELALTSISGFFFTHYYMTWLPLLSLGAGFFMFSISRYMARSTKGVRDPGQLANVISPALTLVLFLPPVLQLLPGVQETMRQASEAEGLPAVDLSTRAWIPVVTYAAENLEEDDPFLVWGNEAKLNWLADRHPPIRFFYHSALLQEAYMSPEKVRELINQMEANPPTIVDTGPPGGFMPALKTPLNELPEDLRPLYRYFQENYEYAGTFEIGWDLYLYHGNGVPLN